MSLLALQILRARAEQAAASARRLPAHALASIDTTPGSRESKSVSNVDPQSERDQIIDAIVRAIPMDNLELGDEFFPAHLPVALMDAIFRTRFRHDSPPVPFSERYCRHFGIARTRADRWNPPPAHEQESLCDLIRRYEEFGVDAIASEVFGIRRRHPGRKPTRAEDVLRAARALRSIGVEVLQDMSSRNADEIQAALEFLPGFGKRTVRRVLMYAGDDDFVRGDLHVRRFVATAVGRESISSAEAEALVREAAHEMILSPRFLDREIWRYGFSS